MSPLSAVLLVSGYRSSLEQERGRAEKLLRLGRAGGGRWAERTPRIFSVLSAPPDSKQVGSSHILSPRVVWEFSKAQNVLHICGPVGKIFTQHHTYIMAFSRLVFTVRFILMTRSRKYQSFNVSSSWPHENLIAVFNVLFGKKNYSGPRISWIQDHACLCFI